ncbi:DUF1990 family protein [Leucobacter japonicus]|uniref:DUF1990 family protein n=1 Tax=Leucobacter japonicus TaxID=1461259 RepID=UPI000949915C|nr:DUF1990 family protein [Leucobacter japonicus]
MSKEQPPRRSSHVEMPVTYAAVGASKQPDIVKFPPEGMTSYEEELRLGSGQERFLLASSLLMTWGAQRGSGVRVTDIVRGSGAEYAGPSFSGDGIPEAAGELEEHFGPDGEPFIVAGTTATLHAGGQDPRGILVIYTIDDDRCVGFAWGTRDEQGAVGEQRFAIEFRPDDTVWAVARGFVAAPKSGLLGLKGRADVRIALDAVKSQLASLAPGAQPTPNLGAADDETSVAIADDGDAADVSGRVESSPEASEVLEPEFVESGETPASDEPSEPSAASELIVEEETVAFAEPEVSAEPDASAEPEASQERTASPVPEASPETEASPLPEDSLEPEASAVTADSPQPSPVAEPVETAGDDSSTSEVPVSTTHQRRPSSRR